MTKDSADDWLKEFEEEKEEEPAEEVKEEPEKKPREEGKGEEPKEGKEPEETGEVDEFDKMFEEEAEKEVEEKVEEKVEEEVEEKVEEKPKEELVKREEEERPSRKLTEAKAKLIFVIFGGKGKGKTFQALSFPGKIIALSFDRKTDIIKQNLYNGDERIKVYDMIETLDYSDDSTMLKSADETFKRTLKILEESKNEGPDWILIDCLPETIRMAEFTMRFRNDLAPFEGIKNLNIWKERRMFIRQIHKLAYEAARRGVIYTTDSEKDEIVEAGELVTKQDAPVWLDIIMRETDFVLKTDYNRTSNKHIVRVDTSKDDKLLKTGSIFDVSNYGKIGEIMEK